MTDAIDPRHARLIVEHAKAMGVTHARGAVEVSVKKLTKALKERAPGNAIARDVPGWTVKRPATARRAQLPGPRAILPGAIDDDEPPTPETDDETKEPA
jgi:hypothetical protein